MILGLRLPSQMLGQVPNAPNISTKPETGQTVAGSKDTARFKLTATDVEAFLDRVVPLQLAREDIDRIDRHSGYVF